MSLYSHESFISLPEELGEEIEVVAKYSIESTGIGSYEYWGAVGYDVGVDYPEIQEIELIWTDQDFETTTGILEYISKEYVKICGQIEEQIEQYEPDYED